jgi:hypothetical protein
MRLLVRCSICQSLLCEVDKTIIDQADIDMYCYHLACAEHGDITEATVDGTTVTATPPPEVPEP